MKPVFLYNGPHPAHDRMATAIDAEYVECSKGGVLNRLRAGADHDFGERPVLIEGGVPLLETGFMGIFGNSGPVIELAADATLIDLETPLEERSSHERLAHRFGSRYVDATIAVSDYIAGIARRRGRPTTVTHPFVEQKKYKNLINLDIGGDGETILCVGKYRYKNGQDILVDAMRNMDDYTAHFIGLDTQDIKESHNIQTYGFVGLGVFYEMISRADLMVYPARVGAYPVAILEALVGGTPVVTTPYVGNADLIRSIHPRLVCEPKQISETIQWATSKDLTEFGRRGREVGRGFREEPFIESFVKQYKWVCNVLDVNGQHNIDSKTTERLRELGYIE